MLVLMLAGILGTIGALLAHGIWRDARKARNLRAAKEALEEARLQNETLDVLKEVQKETRKFNRRNPKEEK